MGFTCNNQLCLFGRKKSGNPQKRLDNVYAYMCDCMYIGQYASIYVCVQAYVLRIEAGWEKNVQQNTSDI